jgi:hypothetical protein
MKVYHSTNKQNLAKIMLSGLKINSQNEGYAQDAKWATMHYGNIWPIFVSLSPGIYDGIVLEIELPEEFILYPDLPELIETGAYLTEDNKLSWELDPDELVDILNNGEIEIQELMENPEARKAAISLTGTAVILQNIPSKFIQMKGE